MAELADALDLGSSGETLESSILSSRTKGLFFFLKGDNQSSMKPQSLRLFLVCGIILSFVWASPLFSQQEDIAKLRQENAALEAKVNELESRLKQCTEERNRQFSEDQGWQNKKNWRSLETGMKEAQVTKILGEPVKIIKGVKTFWYYPNLYGGYVSFDEKGAVRAWKEP